MPTSVFVCPASLATLCGGCAILADNAGGVCQVSVIMVVRVPRHQHSAYRCNPGISDSFAALTISGTA